jgi:hypothetical protein
MANKDLFKQAIADAKSIREAAITNAKLALEESLTPQLKELLAQRLAEMEEEAETEEVLAEAEIEEAAEETPENPEDHTKQPGYVTEEEAEDEKEEEEGEEAGEEEAEDDSEESEDEAEEDLEVEDMTVEDLKDLIRDILSQEMGDEEPAGEEGDEEAEDMVGMDMTAEPEAEAGEEEINLEELMAELAAMANEGEEVVAEEEIEETINDPETDSAHGNVAEEESMEEIYDIGDLSSVPQHLQYIGILAPWIAALTGLAITVVKDKLAKGGAEAAKLVKTATEKSKTQAAPMKETEELAEALATIETLQKDLNEVNLLNAKLLYVNKVFKANNLTESQKATVIAAFDKAETVKEVKLVFETVSENVPSGKKEVVKEAKGFASAAVGKSDKPEVITEANAAVLRMQKLAGIIK